MSIIVIRESHGKSRQTVHPPEKRAELLRKAQSLTCTAALICNAPPYFPAFPPTRLVSPSMCVLLHDVTHWATGCRVYREGGVVWCEGVRGKAFASTIDEGQAD